MDTLTLSKHSLLPTPPGLLHHTSCSFTHQLVFTGFSSLQDIRYNGSHFAYICALYHIYFFFFCKCKFNLQHLVKKWGGGG